ncbi:hypothetical protein GGR58DRAFT_526848 [Xylaria digitata]|nr:hypothetical protein GGR58DRAFT_526848 [Xylaria digitata]
MDVENKENIPPPGEGRGASWRDDEVSWDELYSGSTVEDNENLTHELGSDLANKCLSFAEKSLAETGPYIDQLEMQYQECPADITPEYIALFISSLQALYKHIELPYRLSVLVDKYRPEPEIQYRTETIQALAGAYSESLDAFIRSLAHDIHETRRRHQARQPRVPVRRYEETLPRAQNGRAVATPLANQPRRARQQRHSSDLRWRREGRDW